MSLNSVDENGNRVMLSTPLSHWRKCMKLSVSFTSFCTCILIVDFCRLPKTEKRLHMTLNHRGRYSMSRGGSKRFAERAPELGPDG